jgi:hypothetical protein
VQSQNDLPIGEVKVLVDGRPATGEAVAVEAGATDVRRTIAQEVDLSPGPNRITVLATNRESNSQPITVVVTREAPEPADERPTVYLLAVGVSQYAKQEISLQFAHKDAADFASAWRSQQGPLYAAIEARILPNAEATAMNIRDGLQWLSKTVTRNDRAVVFLAAHGVLDESGDYYLGTHEIDPERLPATGLPAREFEGVIRRLPCTTLVFVDTCHSGELGRKLVGDPLRDLSSDEVGAVMFASSLPREQSLEDAQWGHGAFAKALLDTLGDRSSDLNKNGFLSIVEMEYQIQERVKELTEGQQNPTVGKPTTIPNIDFFRFPASGGPPPVGRLLPAGGGTRPGAAHAATSARAPG